MAPIPESKVSSAAVLSLALTVGACTFAFRLADAILFSAAVVANPERLFALEYDLLDDATGQIEQSGTCQYPLFRPLPAAVKSDPRTAGNFVPFPHLT